MDVLFCLLGLGLLIKGADWLITGASAIAKRKGLSDAVIGLTVVAIGTSLPEPVTSVTAALKRRSDITVGSDIFNVFRILGLMAVIRPLPYTAGSDSDISVLVPATVGLMVLILSGERGQTLGRWQGGAFICGLYRLCQLSDNQRLVLSCCGRPWRECGRTRTW